MTRGKIKHCGFQDLCVCTESPQTSAAEWWRPAPCTDNLSDSLTHLWHVPVQKSASNLPEPPLFHRGKGHLCCRPVDLRSTTGSMSDFLLCCVTSGFVDAAPRDHNAALCCHPTQDHSSLYAQTVWTPCVRAHIDIDFWYMLLHCCGRVAPTWWANCHPRRGELQEANQLPHLCLN